MSDIDPVIFEFQAKVNGYLADLNKTTRAVDQNLGRQEARIRQLEGEFRRSSGAISGHLKTLTGALAGAFTAQGAQTLIDDFTRMQNQLRVAGLEGRNFEDVQARLLAIGTRYGTSLNSLAELYSKSAQSQRDLGASQEQILGLTEETSQALLITGTNSQAASGAILGLGQALASGTVHAEEYNQMLEGGLQPLLAAAAASDRWGGSLGKLRQDIAAGKVSSLELFRAMLEGAKLLEGQASKAVLTLSGSFIALNNQLIKYVGSAASSQGITGALSAGIAALAENLDTIIPLLATIATYMGVKWVTGAIAASAATGALATATFALQARMAGAATTAEALGFALNGLKLNLVAVGITALVAGIAYLSARSNEAAQAAADLDAAIDAQAKTYAGLHAQQSKAAAETNNLTSQQRAAITSTASLTGEVGLLANAWARVAAQAKFAAIEQARAAKNQAQTNYRQAKTAYDDKVERIASTRKAYGNLGGTAGVFLSPEGRKALQTAAPTEEAKRLQKAAQNYQDAANDYLTQVNTPLAKYKAEAPAVAPPKPGKTSKGSNGSKASGPSEAEIGLKFDEDMARLRAEELRAQLDVATDADTRADLSKELLQAEYEQRVAQVEAEKHFTRAQKDAQIAALQKLYGAPAQVGPDGVPTVSAKPGLFAQAANRDTERERASIAENSMQAESAALQSELDAATNRKKRAEIEARILQIQQDIEDAHLADAISTGQIAAADAQRATDLLHGKHANEKKALADRTSGPLAQYAQGLSDKDANDLVEGYVVDELNSVRDGIHSAISKTLGIKDPLISGLLNMLIEQVIMKPIAEALSKSGGGLGGLISSVGSAIFGRASGGSVNAGQMYRVNEAASPGRVEGFMPQGSGQIIPLGKMNAMVGGGSSARVFHINVDARNSVTPAGFARELSANILSHAAQMDAQASQYTLRAVPGRIDQYQRDGN